MHVSYHQLPSFLMTTDVDPKSESPKKCTYLPVLCTRNGNVTLEGVVASEADRNIAGIQARSVPGVFFGYQYLTSRVGTAGTIDEFFRPR